MTAILVKFDQQLAYAVHERTMHVHQPSSWTRETSDFEVWLGDMNLIFLLGEF